MVSRAVFANFEHSVFRYPNVTSRESSDLPQGSSMLQNSQYKGKVTIATVF